MLTYNLHIITSVKAPWIKIAVLADNNNYIVPGKMLNGY